MQLRERLYSKILGVVVVALTFVTAVAVISSKSASAGRPDPRTHLQCPSDRMISTIITHDSTTKETRTPERLAEAWAASMKGQRANFRPTDQRTAFSSKNGRDIALADGPGHPIAVLSYEMDADLGWRLESVIECA